MLQNKEYNEDSIHVFEGLKGVRKRPEMYIGSTNDPTQLLKEVVDNSIDEYLAGYNNEINIITSDKEIIVSDKGRGIPVKIHKDTKKSTLDTIMTTLHAGGKFNSDSYLNSRGLHGVGVSVVNGLSSKFEVWTNRENRWYYQMYKNGIPEFDKLQNKKPPLSQNKGTIIRFIPDDTIFKTLKIKQSYLKELEAITMFSPKLKIKIDFYGDKKEYFFKSMKEYVNIKIKENKKISKFIENTSSIADICIVWTDKDNEEVDTYVNTIKSIGTHYEAFKKALTFVLNKYKNNGDKLDSQDYRMGMVGIIHYKCNNPSYSGQVKNELTSNAKDLEDYLKKIFDEFFSKYKNLANKIVKRAVDIKKAKQRYKEEVNAISSTKMTKRISLPSKLSISSKKTPVSKRELYLVEGDSAAGTARKSKFDFQEVFPISGKPLNAYKNNLNKVINSKNVLDIFRCIGIDLTKKNPLENIRVNKVILLSDADVDGHHINLLLIALFHKLVPELINLKKLYIVNAPLYHAKIISSKGTELITGNTYKEVEDKLKNKKSLILRSKGWGEIDAKSLSNIAFNLNTRKIELIQSVDKKSDRIVSKLLSEDTNERKKILGLL